MHEGDIHMITMSMSFRVEEKRKWKYLSGLEFPERPRASAGMSERQMKTDYMSGLQPLRVLIPKGETITSNRLRLAA